MNYTDATRAKGFARLAPSWFGLLLLGAVTASVPALAQQKTGPGLNADDSLTWNGITLYGVIDIGLQYDTHSAPFTPYRPAASGNIVRQNDYQSVTGLTPSNMGQSRVGLQGVEPLNDELSAVFQVETFFNPQSGEIGDSLKSLAMNNGKALTSQSIGVDGSSAGQAFQTAYVGLSSARFGTLTFGRQETLLALGSIKYDPNYGASAFGLIGASNTYSGGGSSEDNRLDSTAKYSISFNDLVHFAALYKFNGSNGAANTAVQADIGGQYAGLSLDAYYSKVNSAITASALTAAQVAELPTLGYSASNTLAATISDNTTYSLMALYTLDPLKFFAGYMHIVYANPANPLSPGFSDIGGYILGFVTNDAYDLSKTVQVYWTGVRYTVFPNFDLTAAYYGYQQNAYDTGKNEGCSTSAHSSCSGRFEAFSLDADYHFNKHFDAYLGAMYSGVRWRRQRLHLLDQHQPHRRRSLQVLMWPPRINWREGFFRRAAFGRGAAGLATRSCKRSGSGRSYRRIDWPNLETQMSKVLVLYYSEFGYVTVVAHAIADGARSAGAVVDIKRVPEIAPIATPHGAYFNPVHDDPVAEIEDLPNYDAIIVGSPTRFGRLSSPVAGFLEEAGELASRGILNGKVGGAFVSPTSRNGGQEAAWMSIINNILQFGMIVVGPPNNPTTLADESGERHPSALDLEGARQQGRLIAQTAEKLSGRRELGVAHLEPSAAPAAATREIEVVVALRDEAHS